MNDSNEVTMNQRNDNNARKLNSKTCSHCNKIHPFSDFYKNKNTKDGL